MVHVLWAKVHPMQPVLGTSLELLFWKHAGCYYKDSFAISRALSPSSERTASLFLCANRRMRLPPRVKLNLGLSLSLLLAGDVRSNPGLVVPNLRLGAVNARLMRDKAPGMSQLVVSKGIDLLDVTEIWLNTRETSIDLGRNDHHHPTWFLLSSDS